MHVHANPPTTHTHLLHANKEKTAVTRHGDAGGIHQSQNTTFCQEKGNYLHAIHY